MFKTCHSEFTLIYSGTLFLWIVKNQSVCPLRPCWEQNERNFLIYPTMSQGRFCFWQEIEDSCPVQLQFPDYRQFTLEANLAKGQSDWIAYLPVYQAVYSDLMSLPYISAEWSYLDQLSEEVWTKCPCAVFTIKFCKFCIVFYET